MLLSELSSKIESEISVHGFDALKNMDVIMRVMMKFSDGKENPVQIKKLIDECYWRMYG